MAPACPVITFAAEQKETWVCGVIETFIVSSLTWKIDNVIIGDKIREDIEGSERFYERRWTTKENKRENEI